MQVHDAFQDYELDWKIWQSCATDHMVDCAMNWRSCVVELILHILGLNEVFSFSELPRTPLLQITAISPHIKTIN